MIPTAHVPTLGFGVHDTPPPGFPSSIFPLQLLSTESQTSGAPSTHPGSVVLVELVDVDEEVEVVVGLVVDVLVVVGRVLEVLVLVRRVVDVDEEVEVVEGRVVDVLELVVDVA